MIDIEGLTYSFRGSAHSALCQLDLHIEPGEFIVLTGPSGCGKSTLALAIGGYLFQQYDGKVEGRIHVAGMDVQTWPVYDVAEVVGLVQQNPEAQFCTLTVQDEVAFGLENRCLSRSEIRRRMDWALGVVGASHLSDRSLSTLSGGEKQKVAIAAVLAAEPRVLILDEPTSNLDPTATAEVLDVIARIRERSKLTVIVIEHKVDYLRPMRPRLVRMEAGQIVQDGPLAEGEMELTIPPPASTPLTLGTEPLVHVEGLTAGYNGRLVLHDVALHVGAGEFVAVMGDNGSGKSTLLRSLLGLLKPQAGRVEVLGRDTRTAPVSELAESVGFVFQNPDHQLFAESVWDEAIFAPRNFGRLDAAQRAQASTLLARSGLGERLEDHPYQLSYGQKRRLNLVSILTYAPRLVLLDEVLIGQDPENAAFLMGLLDELVTGGGAVVMVNHNPAITRRYADRLVFFAGGQVLVDAPTETAFRQVEALGYGAYVPFETQLPVMEGCPA